MSAVGGASPYVAEPLSAHYAALTAQVHPPPAAPVTASSALSSIVKPSSIGDWYGKLQETIRPVREQQAAGHFDSAVTGMRQNAEGAAMAALLAFIDTDMGGLDFGGRIPLDWLAAIACYLLSIRDAGKPDGYASDLRALGQSATAVATYRTVHRWREARKAVAAAAASGKAPPPKSSAQF